MTIKGAALLALIGMILLTLLVLAGFIRDITSVLDGLIPALRIVASLIYLIASVGVAVFFWVFYTRQA